jgi:hypothetical protein
MRESDPGKLGVGCRGCDSLSALSLTLKHANPPHILSSCVMADVQTSSILLTSC